MARLRYNGLCTGAAGALVPLELGASLTSGGTTITFNAALTHSNGTAVPTISGGDYLPLTILDASGNVVEIVYLTAYTSGATTGTITRGREGTTGVAHASGVKVVNAATSIDEAQTIGASAYLSSAQNVNTGSGLMIPLQTETQDTSGFHDTVTNNTRMTIPTGGDGIYIVSGQVTITAGVTGNKQAIICKNGATSGPTSAVPGAVSRTVITTIMPLVAGDYLELRVFQDSGSTQALEATGLTFLSIARLST